MKIGVIRSHVASIGYEDSNPFSLCGWVLKVAKEDYTKRCEGEFSIWFLTPQNRELLGDIDMQRLPPDIIFVDEYKEVYTKEWLDEMYDIGDLEELIVVAPINQLFNTGDGDISVTSV